MTEPLRQRSEGTLKRGVFFEEKQGTGWER